MHIDAHTEFWGSILIDAVDQGVEKFIRAINDYLKKNSKLPKNMEIGSFNK